MLIDELVGFSNFYGSDPSLVLAGGGNTSAKADGRMWVKGSGTALATITAQGFVEIDLSKLGEIFEKSYPDSDSEREALVLQDLMASRVPGETKRPSVETTLHALFPQTYVSLYDFSRPWITHCSVQRTDLYKSAETIPSLALNQPWNLPVRREMRASEQTWGQTKKLVKRSPLITPIARSVALLKIIKAPNLPIFHPLRAVWLDIFLLTTLPTASQPFARNSPQKSSLPKKTSWM